VEGNNSLNGLPGLNLSYTFDSDLRDAPNSPEDMEAACELLAAQLCGGGLESAEEVKLLGQLGFLSRMLGRLEAAQGYLERAVGVASAMGNKRAALVNGIRLAHVYQWQRAFDEADALFVECLHRCENDPDLAAYTDFACQHYGKSLFDQGRYREAEAMFSLAMEIRLDKGDNDLIDSTRLALQVTRERLS
jgi:tetratricopeptide (TPR) repeat protein